MTQLSLPEHVPLSRAQGAHLPRNHVQGTMYKEPCGKPEPVLLGSRSARYVAGGDSCHHLDRSLLSRIDLCEDLPREALCRDIATLLAGMTRERDDHVLTMSPSL
jgi:hypothetical protein